MLRGVIKRSNRTIAGPAQISPDPTAHDFKNKRRCINPFPPGLISDCHGIIANMKLIILSDTHGMHDHVNVPDGDVIIHCGDVSWHPTEIDVIGFNSWYKRLPHKRKIVIAGNHDRFMRRDLIDPSIDYLQDSSVTIEGVHFYGSPWTPVFYDWYWMKERGEAIAERWRRIPVDTDVLITHGPPHGILDRNREGEHCGCQDLLARLDSLKPSLHCFGHIHEAAGVTAHQGCIMINASIVSRDMFVNNPCQQISLN